jgi:hypothetical protein
MRCTECREALNRASKHLAREIEQAFPGCECEQHSVGIESPGRIDDREILYRMFVSPVDVDNYGRLARQAFETAYVDGLSIIRECANNSDVENLVSDILSVKKGADLKTIRAIFKFECITVRDELVEFKKSNTRGFCVYDQTQPRILRPAETPVGTHGIILSRRLFEPPVVRKHFENDCNMTLHRLIASQPVPVEEFRGGLIAALNTRSLAGEFVRSEH